MNPFDEYFPTSLIICVQLEKQEFQFVRRNSVVLMTLAACLCDQSESLCFMENCCVPELLDYRLIAKVIKLVWYLKNQKSCTKIVTQKTYCL